MTVFIFTTKLIRNPSEVAVQWKSYRKLCAWLQTDSFVLTRYHTKDRAIIAGYEAEIAVHFQITQILSFLFRKLSSDLERDVSCGVCSSALGLGFPARRDCKLVSWRRVAESRKTTRKGVGAPNDAAFC
jgi:hypothetical protein